jgi:hypothetical protein
MIILLFADDMVIFAKSIEQLQSNLNNLKLYCNKWGLEVNTDKTKTMFLGREEASEKIKMVIR